MVSVAVCLYVCLSVCRYVCMYVCNTITRKPGRRKFSFGLKGIRVKFVYEGNRVKVKVTGADKRENPYSCNVNFDRQ